MAFAELLESQEEEHLPRYIRLSLSGESPAEAAILLSEHREEWSALFVPLQAVCNEPLVAHFSRGLPARLTTIGSFIWEGWFTPVTIPVQRLLQRYGSPLDESLRHEHSELAHHAREHREGTGLHEVDILHLGVAPLLERLSPIVPMNEVVEALDCVIHLFRELRARGLDSSRCPRSCVGLAIRTTQRELTAGHIRNLASDLLLTIDSCEGRGSIRGALFEGIVPLTTMLADSGSQEPLRSYIPALTAYVNGLAHIGVPIEAVMRQQLLEISQRLATEISARHFEELTTSALRTTRRA